ncbi:c-type cytochrome [Ruegeria pomeroyi]|uniref:Cytochrome c family protein n=2 Tax=Ruegeria pomeroyi TaxID=89184 RepID=Q5LUC8_RUEPO|nr:cytochrome c [Ruegeria pomeroyi]HCE69772.1 cytochrome C [Ruegeria sp.]AAV94426.1 cytochrome c family protein [Ruegeria pomeroyi DSS-3]NVK99428.1 c-type cytochrome [Ruegeria pomeroyi]NVL04123.1 c-type cytochrome [Ruegeria pomeroyi]QWV08009.1 c-type cytochrome [Ruegeria pomeroyi]
MKPIIPALLALGLATPAPAQDAAEGEQLYRHHCATCHGIEATGHGPMAGVLVISPADLTTLSEGGELPIARIVQRIDGRDPLVSHGSPMPIYGPYFEGRDVAIKAETGQPILTSQPIVDLLAYIATLQKN